MEASKFRGADSTFAKTKTILVTTNKIGLEPVLLFYGAGVCLSMGQFPQTQNANGLANHDCLSQNNEGKTSCLVLQNKNKKDYNYTFNCRGQIIKNVITYL